MFIVVLLAMVAAFLALRLYTVLGKRTGHEQVLPRPAEERAPVTPLPRAIEPLAEAREPGAKALESKAQNGIRQIVAADPAFDLPAFVEGSKGAYRVILEAFWKDDQDTLGWLTEPDVRDSFVAAIAERTSAGHVLDNRLIAIEHATIVDAVLDGKVARITMRFDAAIAAVTRDAEGQVVAGSLSDAVDAHDLWTFTRTLKGGDPDWKLADTDEA